MGPSIFISRPAPSGRPHRLMLTLLLAFSSSFACVASHSSPSVVPEDIAYKSRAEPATAAVKVGTASIPGNSTPAVSDAAPCIRDAKLSSCDGKYLAGFRGGGRIGNLDRRRSRSRASLDFQHLADADIACA